MENVQAYVPVFYFREGRKKSSDFFVPVSGETDFTSLGKPQGGGEFPPGQLENELNKLKDLFIKVNNKRIKL
jgi:hypothetical protein